MITSETGALGIGVSDAETRANRPPVITVEGGDEYRVRVGEPLELAVRMEDDALEAAIGRWKERQQEAAHPTFDPPQVKTWEDTRTGADSPWAPLWRRTPIPEDGVWRATVTFDEPGTHSHSRTWTARWRLPHR